MSNSAGRLSIVAVTTALTLGAVAVPGRETRLASVKPIEVSTALVELGSRETGSEASAKAGAYLREMLGERDWQAVEISTESLRDTLSVVSAGKVDSEIVISAHFDSVAESPGALDNASGCGVVSSTFSELAVRPLHRRLRAVFFDAEEEQLDGSREWIEQQSNRGEPSIFASVSAEMVGSDSAKIGVLHPVSASRDGHWTITPVWLVHAALEGARAVQFPVALVDSRWPIFGQLSLRMARPARLSDSRSFLEAGIPSMTISDVSLTEGDPNRHSPLDTLDRLDADRLDRWAETLAAIVLQIDHLRDRPLDDTEYLAAGGRVWIRRDLLWVGLILWAPMVFRGLPGRWRGASAESKRRRGREYLPGFAFRMLFLISLVLVPTTASVLLYPAAILAWIPDPRSRAKRYLIGSLAFVPLLVYASWLAMAQLGGHLVLHSGAILPLTLATLTLTSYWLWRADQRPFQSA